MKINIMIVTNSAYLTYTYMMLNSLFRSNPNLSTDVYLPYEDLSENEIRELEEFCGERGSTLFPLYVGTDLKSKITSRNGINIETYYRITGINLLPEDVDKILYLDSDMIIKGSIRELYDIDLKGKVFAVCEDIYGKINGFHEANKYRMGIPKEYSYFNAGVMLMNIALLRAEHGPDAMMEQVYANYEKYEYNDQDVMNEMYYDRLIFVGWDIYNCPPCHYYLDKKALAEGRVDFAGYDDIKNAGSDPEKFQENFQNITNDIYKNARIIHYLGDTKPWSKTRKKASVYDIFDRAFQEEKDIEHVLFG